MVLVLSERAEEAHEGIVGAIGIVCRCFCCCAVVLTCVGVDACCVGPVLRKPAPSVHELLHPRAKGQGPRLQLEAVKMPAHVPDFPAVTYGMRAC
jgi:hypothetical protein